MIVVEMNEDIRKTEVKAAGPFTFRQVVCIVVAVCYAFPLGFFIPGDLTVKVIVGGCAALPVIACGWITRDGQHFEIIAIRWIYKKFLTPVKRKKKDLLYEPYRKKIRKIREKNKIKAMSPEAAASYRKRMKKGIKVIYSKKESNKMFA